MIINVSDLIKSFFFTALNNKIIYKISIRGYNKNKMVRLDQVDFLSEVVGEEENKSLKLVKMYSTRIF